MEGLRVDGGAERGLEELTGVLVVQRGEVDMWRQIC